jgi:hypothetical protein
MNMTKRDTNKMQLLIQAGIVKPDVAKLVEITGINKRTICYWMLENTEGLVSNKVSKEIEQKIIDFMTEDDNVTTEKASKKLTDLLGF